MGDKHKFSEGRRGSALPVRVTPRARRNEIVEVLSDSTVKIRLTSPPEEQTNQELVKFLAGVLGVPQANLDIVAGESGRDKLVSILDMDTAEVHRKILENIA